MTEKFKIVDTEFISYYGGYAHIISNGEYKIRLFHDEIESQQICDMLNELSLSKIRYSALKEAHFTKMGGFTMERDGRGCYNICSENVIPKNSAVIRIASPDCTWNDIVADIFSDILTRVEF